MADTMDDLFKGKRPCHVRTTAGGFAVLHVGVSWSMKRITSYVEDHCRVWNTGDYPTCPFAIDLTEFEQIGKIKRRFWRDSGGKWIEVKAIDWSEQQIANYLRFVKDAVDAA
jgi:hypothetical protein